jgi:hypothetical protein
MDVDDSFVHTSRTNRFCEVEWRRLLSAQGIEEKARCAIKPLLKKVEVLTSYDLPHYLFRVWSDSSAGFNCENGEHRFQSQAAKAGLGSTNFEIMEEAEIEDNVRRHLRWNTGTKVNLFHSHWISFTCSVMFALVHACRMVEMGQKNVMFAVINTYMLKTPGRMFSAFPLIRAYKIDDIGIKDSTYAEFLAYDELKAEMEVIPFSVLLHPVSGKPRPGLPGLLRLCPFLKYNEAEKRKARRRQLQSKHKGLGLKSRMKRFRERRFPDLGILQVSRQDRAAKAIVPWRLPQGKRAGPFPISFAILEDFYRLVKRFKPGFRLPMLVSFLSLMTPEWEQDSMEEKVIEMCRGKSIFGYCLQKTKVEQKKRGSKASHSIILDMFHPCCPNYECSKR